MGASGVDHGACHWIKATEVPNVTLGMLLEPRPGYESLDAKLASALRRIISDAPGLSRKVSCLTRQYAAGHVPLSGRQILLLVQQHFRTSERGVASYPYSDLRDIKYPGGERAAEFIDMWLQVTSAMDSELDVQLLEEIFFDEISQSINLFPHLTSTSTLMSPNDPSRT